ncbi:MAG: sigma-70 family RNA polymerase sigma factor [Bacteroidetes bacterium]|nr:sigma-70 family RNA polymerase sigma factor [Bacteroidota bacterium]
MNELIKNIQQGNQQSFQDFYNEYHSKLYLYIYKYTQSEWLAEETVQMSFLKIWENRKNLSLEHDLSAQLFRTGKSIVIDLLRKNEVRKTLPLHSAELQATDVNHSFIEAKNELSLAMSAIETMPPVQQKVFKYSRFKELSHKEISSELSISPKTIETHITRAIKHIKKSLSFF